MAHASKTHIGAGAQGKGDGGGGMTDLPDDVLGENMVLSNRDKSRHGDERGLDGRQVQTEQFHDHTANHERPDEVDEDLGASQSSALGGPRSNIGGEDSTLDRNDGGNS